jgi:hypothetical protein
MNRESFSLPLLSPPDVMMTMVMIIMMIIISKKEREENVNEKTKQLSTSILVATFHRYKYVDMHIDINVHDDIHIHTYSNRFANV